MIIVGRSEDVEIGFERRLVRSERRGKGKERSVAVVDWRPGGVDS